MIKFPRCFNPTCRSSATQNVSFQATPSIHLENSSNKVAFFILIAIDPTVHQPLTGVER